MVAEYRVTALRYRFKSEIEYDHFEMAAPASGVLGSFSYALSNGILEAIPSVEFRDQQAARSALERDEENEPVATSHGRKSRRRNRASGPMRR